MAEIIELDSVGGRVIRIQSDSRQELEDIKRVLNGAGFSVKIRRYGG